MNKFWTIYIIFGIVTYIINDFTTKRYPELKHKDPRIVQAANIFLAIFWFAQWLIIIGGVIAERTKKWHSNL